MATKFSEKDLLTVLSYSASQLGASYEQIYDFTRCVRPNGTAYGTSGQCRKGVEQDFESDRGIQTEASGGVIRGSLFSKKNRDFNPIWHQDADEELMRAAKEYAKPFKKREKAKKFLNAANRLLDSYKTELKYKGADLTLNIVRNTQRKIGLAIAGLEMARKKRYLRNSESDQKFLNQTLTRLERLNNEITATPSYKLIDVLRDL